MLPSSWMDASGFLAEDHRVFWCVRSSLPCASPIRSSSIKITSVANLSQAFLQHEGCLSHHFATVFCCERFLPPLLSYQVFFISSFNVFAFCCQLQADAIPEVSCCCCCCEASPVSRMSLVLHFENLPCRTSVVAQNCLQQRHSNVSARIVILRLVLWLN